MRFLDKLVKICKLCYHNSAQIHLKNRESLDKINKENEITQNEITQFE